MMCSFTVGVLNLFWYIVRSFW